MNKEVRRYSLLFILIYGVMGAAGLVGQALNSLTKDGLGLTASQSATFFAVASITTYLGPLYGMFSDTTPLFGTRRRSYLILYSLAGALAWGAMGIVHSPLYWLALALFAIALATDTAATTVANALMVDVGKPSGLTGVFQSVQWGAANVMAVVGAWFSGDLVERFGRNIPFLIYALFPLLAAVGTMVLLRDPPESRGGRSIREAWQAIRSTASSRAHWLVAFFLFAWFFSPGLGVALYYYQRDVLHFTPSFIGKLQAIFWGSGILAAVAYARLSPRVPIRRLLVYAVGLGTLGHLAYLGMMNPATAVLVYVVDGALSLFAMLAVLDLGARVTPAKIEGTAFSLLISARLLAIFLGSIVGGKLYELVGLHALVVISASFTGACVLFIRWLPEPARVVRW